MSYISSPSPLLFLLLFAVEETLTFYPVYLVTFELTKHRGWAPADSAESMLHDAQARLPKEGWDGVRPSIAATVRCVFLPFFTNPDNSCVQYSVLYLQAFLVGPLAHDRPRQVSLFAKALEILDNGRTLWANVSKDDRGAVFEPTFIRGIRTAHLDALMEVRPASFRSATIFLTSTSITHSCMLKLPSACGSSRCWRCS